MIASITETCPCKQVVLYVRPSGSRICENCGGAISVIVPEKPRA